MYETTQEIHENRFLFHTNFCDKLHTYLAAPLVNNAYKILELLHFI